MDRLTRILATVGGSGYFPFAPATFASLIVTIVLYLVPGPSPMGWVVATLAVAVVGVPVSTRAERWFGHDGSPIVIDEALGMLITLFMLPKTIPIYVAGFLLFRVFDIAKPFPAGRAQSLPGGWGVMIDDVLAAIYAHLALRILIVLVW